MSGRWQGSDRAHRLPKDWHRRRARILKRDPICKACKREPSKQVDHIQPSGSDEDWNLQGLCESCHKAKTGREARAAQLRKSPKRTEQRHPGLI